jgi:hypothetical protein
MAVFSLVLVTAVLYEVIPRSRAGWEVESLTELKQRLDTEYKARKEELRRDLDDWRIKNEDLRKEIDRLKGEGESWGKSL